MTSAEELSESARVALSRVYALLLDLGHNGTDGEQEKRNDTEQEKAGGDEPPARTDNGGGDGR